MTQEDKQLLLTDLCARLSYDVKCHFKYGSAEDDITLSCIDNNVARFEYGWCGRFHVSIDTDYIKPYLRPMSSMTEEEREELRQEHIKDEQLFADCIKNHPEMRGLIIPHFAADWCNKKMFDYRCLITKGLALEAPKGMYKEEQQ